MQGLEASPNGRLAPVKAGRLAAKGRPAGLEESTPTELVPEG